MQIEPDPNYSINNNNRFLIGKILGTYLSAKVVPALLEEPSCFLVI